MRIITPIPLTLNLSRREREPVSNVWLRPLDGGPATARLTVFRPPAGDRPSDGNAHFRLHHYGQDLSWIRSRNTFTS